MRLTAAASILLGLAALAVLALFGGAGVYARPLFASVAVVALVLSVVGMGRRYRLPPLSWLLWIFLPALAVMALQLVPLPWHHPWLDRDLPFLGSAAPAWSLDPGATFQGLVWTMALAAAALVWHCHVRGERARMMAYIVISIAVAHAVLALVLALAAVDWPTPSYGFSVRGCFVYHNQAAAFSACCLPLAILLAREQKQPWPWFGVGALSLAVILSNSRGGTMVCALVCLPVVWKALPRRRRAWWFAMVVIAISSYLAAIGLHEVSLGFGRLIGPEGLTLDGRLLIWRDAMPLIRHASPLGTGVDTAQGVFWRAGTTAFPGLTVNHLHSDPLEWILEFGWAGTLAIALGLVVVAVRLARLPTGASKDPALYRGGAMGLLILALHSCGDFIWNREAIALMAVVLMILVVEGREDHQLRQTRSARGLRLGGLALAIVLALCLPRAWVLDDEQGQVRELEKWVQGRRQNGLPLNGGFVDQVLARHAHSVQLAVAQARLSLDLGQGLTTTPESEPLLQAHLASAGSYLGQAASLAPADAGAFVERARLAAVAPRAGQLLPPIIDRILVWSPSWPYADAILLECLRHGGMSLLPDAQRRRLIDSMLALDQAQPAWFFRLAELILGQVELSQRLQRQAPTALLRSAQSWIASRSSESQWLEVWRHLAPDHVTLSCYQSLLSGPLSGDGRHLRVTIPLQSGYRRQQADELALAGLPIPSELASALAGDGAPYSLWASPLDPSDRSTDSQLVKVLASELYQPWASSWFDTASNALVAFSGNTLRMNADSDPRLLQRLLEVDGVLSTGERLRLRQLLEAHRRPQWNDLPGLHWSWLWCDGSQRPLVRSDQWQGWIVDGSWQGWRRGVITSADIGGGLHRVAVMTPPTW